MKLLSDILMQFGVICRSKIAIIPQDPFLFSSSVRENLDPSGRYLDDRLLDALEQCHLGDVVRRMGEYQGEKSKISWFTPSDTVLFLSIFVVFTL